MERSNSALKSKREERILDALLPPARDAWGQNEQTEESSNTRQTFRKKLREGKLDDKEIEVDVAAPQMGWKLWLLLAWKK